MKSRIIKFVRTHPKVVFGVGLTASIAGLASSSLGLSAALNLVTVSALTRPVGTFSNSVGSLWNLSAARAINGPAPIPPAAPKIERKILKFAQAHRKAAIGIGISALFIGMASAGIGLSAALGLVAVSPIVFSATGTVCSAIGGIWNHTISREINKPAAQKTSGLKAKITGYARVHPKIALGIGASATLIGFASAGIGLSAALGLVALSPLIFSPLGTACGAFGGMWNFTAARVINGPVPMAPPQIHASSLMQTAALDKEFTKAAAGVQKKSQTVNPAPSRDAPKP